MDAQSLKYNCYVLNAVIYAILLFVAGARGGTPAATTQAVKTLSVLHTTTLPARNEKFQSDLKSGMLAMVAADTPRVNKPARWRALADWSERSGAAAMLNDEIIQQAFLTFLEYRKSDEMRAIFLLEFVSGLSIPPTDFAISLTRYLDFPDADVREAALQIMDAERVFELDSSYERDEFDVVDCVLPQPFDMSQLPAPFLEAMLHKDPVLARADFATHRDLGTSHQESEAERKASDADAAPVLKLTFELSRYDYPYNDPKNKEVETILAELLKSQYWYSRLMVAHLLKHHPQYITKEIMASLNGDSSKAVRELTKLISGDADISSEGQMWPDAAKQKH